MDKQPKTKSEFRFRAYDSLLKKYVYFGLHDAAGKVPVDMRDSIEICVGKYNIDAEMWVDSDFLTNSKGQLK